MIILLAAIGPIMRTIGAVGQLGAIFNNVRAGGIKRFKGNVVELNQSLMKTSDIALRIGGNFKKFGQDGKIFTTRKDAKRLEKLAPIIAKQDAGEELTPKEKAKRGKYIKQLAGSEAIKDKTALLPKGVQNLKGLDMGTRDYIKSLDPIFQANQIVDNALTDLNAKRTSIFRKAIQKALKIRAASNNATGAGIDPATGGPAGAAAFGPALPTGPAAVTTTLGGITVLRDLLSQILTSIQAIQACVCNAKAAATGRPSPAASGAPATGPPTGGAGGTTPAAATTGTPAPTGAAVTAVTGPITAAAVAAKQTYAELIKTSPLFQKYGLGLRDVIATVKDLNRGIQSSISSKNLNVEFAMVKTISQDAVFTKVLLEKYGIDINKIVDQYRQAVVNARNNLVAGARPVAPAQALPANFMNPMALMNAMAPISLQPAVDKAMHAVAETVMVSIGKKPVAPTASPVPAAIETATDAGNKVVAENIVEGAKRRGGRPKGSTNKPKNTAPAPPPVIEAPVSPASMARDPFGVVASFGGLGNDPIIKAKVKMIQSVTDIVTQANQTGEKLAVDFTSIGKDIAQALGIQKISKNSYAVTKEAIISMFNTLGIKVPAELAQIAQLINKETGELVATSAAGLAKLAAQVQSGTVGAAMGAGSGQITGKSGNPFYVQQLNTDFGKATETGVKKSTQAQVQSKALDASAVQADFQRDYQNSIERINRLRQNRETLDRLQDEMFVKIELLFKELKKADDSGNTVKSNAIAARIQALQSGLARAKTLATTTDVKAVGAARNNPAEVARSGGRSAFLVAQGDRQSSRDIIQREISAVRDKLVEAQELSVSKKGMATIPMPGSSGFINPKPMIDQAAQLEKMLQQIPKLFQSTADVRAAVARSNGGSRYVDLAYGAGGARGESKFLQDRKGVTSGVIPKSVITPERRDLRLQGIEAARKAALSYRINQEAAAEARRNDRIRLTEPQQDMRVSGGAVVKKQMTQDDLLRINKKDIAEAEKAIPTLERRVNELLRRISEINSQARVPGGKASALRPLKADLKEVEGILKGTKEKLVELTTLPKPVARKAAKKPAPDLSEDVRPRSLSAGVPSGATTLGNINSQLSATLQIPTNVLDQFYQTLKIQGKGLAEVASNAGLLATDELALLKQELTKIGLTIEQAIAKPTESLKLLQAAKFDKGGGVQDLFQRLVMYARDVADKGVQEAFDLTKQRLDAAKARATGSAKASSPASAAKKPAAKAASTADQDAVVNGVIKSINETKTVTDQFLQFTDRPLRKLAEHLNKMITDPAFKIDTKAKKAERTQGIIKALDHLKITVEKAILTEAIAPVNAATDAVKKAAATASKIPAGFMNPMSMINAMKPSIPSAPASRIPAGFMDPARMVGAMAPPPLVAPVSVAPSTNLREILAERLAVKAAMEERIRNNVRVSQSIRAVREATAAANREAEAARTRIEESYRNIPTRPSRRVAPLMSPVTKPMSIFESIAKRISPSRFGEQDVYKTRDYMGEARQRTFGRIADRNLQPTSRQTRIAEKDARVVAKDIRSTDRPDRGVRVLTQSQIPSQFRQTINPTIDTFKAIAKIYIPKLKAAEYIAKTVAREGLIVAAQITKELIYLPKTVPVMFTKAVVEAHKLAMQGIRAGVAALESMAFFQTTRTGKSLLFLAKTIETNLTRVGSVATSAGQALASAGQATAKFVTTAFTDPKQALAMAATGLTNSKDLLFKAGGGLLGAAKSIGIGAAKLAQVGLLAGQAGVNMATGAAKRGVTSIGQSTTAFLYGGGPKGLIKADDGTVTKKAGLFGRSAVTDAAGNTTRGPGIMGRMKGGIGRGVTGAIGGLGTAAGSMSSMMLYQLGPAGLALQGPLNKVISLLTRTKAAFFGISVPIMLVVGAIFLLKRTFSAYGDKTTGVAENFKTAFKAVMAVVGMLKRAFFDFFASLFGGAESTGQATGNIATIVTKVAETTRKFAVAFQAFFTKTILPAIYSFLTGLSMVIRAIFSFVSNLVKFVMAIVSFFRGGGDKAKEAMVSAMKGMLEALVNALKGLLKMVLPVLTLLIKAVTKVVELIVQLFEWLVIGVINLIRYMVTGIINLVFTIVKAYVFIIDKIIELFVLLETTAIKIATEMVIAVIKIFFGIVRGTVAVVKGIISIFAKLPAGVGKGIGMIGELIAGLIRGIGDKLGGIFGIGPKIKSALYSVADGFEKAGNAVQGVGEKTTAALENGVDAIFTPVENAIGGIQNKAIGLVKGISGALVKGVSSLNGVGDAVMGVVQKIQNKLLTAVDISADVANAFIGGFSDAIASAGNGITDWLSSLVDGDSIKTGIGDAINEGVKAGAKDPSAANEAGRAIADSIKDGMKSLKDNFYDKVISNLSDSLGKLKDQVTKALEKQKDQSLKFFDDQIAAIDALAEADAELTAEKQKQEDERLRIAERALQRDSYLKNRALAIYEGRIDDARTMGLEEAKNQQEFNKTTEKNAKDAEAAAKSKNVDAAKQVITKQKEAASIQFDSILEDYQAFLESVGKNGTLTQAELTTQFNDLKVRAGRVSTDMQNAFQGYYNALPGLIAANTEPTVGFFTASMDTLIAGAQKKFGLESGSTDPTSLLGVTNGMLGNMGTAYTIGFTDVVAPAYDAGQTLLTDIAREFADPSTSNPKSAAGIYASAISNATAAIKAEFMKMKTEAGSAFALVVGAINEELKGLAITKAITDATEDLKKGGTSQKTIDAATPVVPTPTTPDTPTGSTPPTASARFGPANIAKAAFEKALGTDGLFKDGDSNNYIKKAKEALSFYGYSGFTTATGDFGTNTIKALKSFQKEYGVGGNSDGNLGVSAANALGLFGNAGVQKKYNGGMIKKMMGGGAVPGFSNQGVPAVLHGGEYVINAKAVQNLGLGLLAQLNGLKNGVPSINVPKPMMPNSSGMNVNVTSHSSSETTQNYNFYVDNFIGEDRWFESMMKEYNVKVIPNNQKAAGLESRVVRTYNGINRGM
jgi:phage-related protein